MLEGDAHGCICSSGCPVVNSAVRADAQRGAHARGRSSCRHSKPTLTTARSGYGSPAADPPCSRCSTAPRARPHARARVITGRFWICETTWTASGREQGYHPFRPRSSCAHLTVAHAAISTRVPRQRYAGLDRRLADRAGRHHLAPGASRTHRLQRTRRRTLLSADCGPRGRSARGLREQRLGSIIGEASAGSTGQTAVLAHRRLAARHRDARRVSTARVHAGGDPTEILTEVRWTTCSPAWTRRWTGQRVSRGRRASLA
jgi:hypothetical protein